MERPQGISSPEKGDPHGRLTLAGLLPRLSQGSKVNIQGPGHRPAPKSSAATFGAHSSAHTPEHPSCDSGCVAASLPPEK